MKSIKELQDELFRLGQISDLPNKYLLIGDQFFDVSINVEIHDGNYHYIVVERGSEKKRIVAKSSFDIMYLFLKSASFAAASKHEVEHRIPDQDFRRQLFQRQLYLLKKIDINLERRLQKEIDEVLERNPYNDG